MIVIPAQDVAGVSYSMLTACEPVGFCKCQRALQGVSRQGKRLTCLQKTNMRENHLALIHAYTRMIECEVRETDDDQLLFTVPASW